ncbi:MAG: cytochrome c [Gemmatimonadota bacterium]|nr:cytochrome c [Gemmatimonadota bacterium]
MPSRILPHGLRVGAAAVALAVLAGVAPAQGGGNTTRVRPDTAKPKPAPAGSTQVARPVMPADNARKPDSAATTDSLTPASIGVFTADQAAKGKDIYLTNCVSCHTPADHTGGGFWSDLVGKRVAKFYKYLRENMPQDNAGAISDEDYASVVAYIFQLNGLPPGAAPLSTDTLKLSRIRITQPDSTRKGP